MICEKCGEKHSGSFGSGRFCSRKCANSRKWTSNDKAKKSESSRTSIRVQKEQERRREENQEKQIAKICPVCKTNFSVLSCHQTRIYCSKKCHQSDPNKELRYKLPSGGIRHGAGRGKSGYYKGFWCDSTYELAYLLYCLEHEIEIDRNTQSFQYFDPKRKGTFLFYPDFLIDKIKLVEIKGYKSYVDELKIKAVQNIPIDIYYKDDLQEAFTFVKEQFGIGTESLHTLYDDFKPRFEYTCLNCETQFSSERKTGTFCSRLCAGQYRGNHRKSELVCKMD